MARVEAFHLVFLAAGDSAGLPSQRATGAERPRDWLEPLESAFKACVARRGSSRPSNRSPRSLQCLWVRRSFIKGPEKRVESSLS